MYMQYRRLRKKLSIEMKIVLISLLVSAIFSAWLPYLIAAWVGPGAGFGAP